MTTATMVAIAERVGLSPSGVRKLALRAAELRDIDKSLRAALERIQLQVSLLSK